MAPTADCLRDSDSQTLFVARLLLQSSKVSGLTFPGSFAAAHVHMTPFGQ